MTLLMGKRRCGQRLFLETMHVFRVFCSERRRYYEFNNTWARSEKNEPKTGGGGGSGSERGFVSGRNIENETANALCCHTKLKFHK